MKESDDETFDERIDEPDDKLDFIQEFIDRKKLQNRVLQELIDKLNQAENNNSE